MQELRTECFIKTGDLYETYLLSSRMLFLLTLKYLRIYNHKDMKLHTRDDGILASLFLQLFILVRNVI